MLQTQARIAAKCAPSLRPALFYPRFSLSPALEGISFALHVFFTYLAYHYFTVKIILLVGVFKNCIFSIDNSIHRDCKADFIQKLLLAILVHKLLYFLMVIGEQRKLKHIGDYNENENKFCLDRGGCGFVFCWAQQCDGFGDD